MSKKLNSFFISTKENNRCQESQKLWHLSQLAMILETFSIHLTYFHFQRQNLVKNIDLVKNRSLINLCGFIMMQGIAKFQTMLQRKQPTEGVLFLSCSKALCQLEKLTCSERRKTFGQKEKRPALKENYFFQL